MPSSVNFWVGLDVHKDSVTAAVFRNRDPEPLRVDRLPYDLHRIRRYFQRMQAKGNVRACYEASGAGYVLQRALLDWGVECQLAASSLPVPSPTRTTSSSPSTSPSSSTSSSAGTNSTAASRPSP